MHYPSPQWLAKVDGSHTWLNKWRMQGNFTKSKGWYHPKEGESCSVPAKDRRNAWTLGGTIDQVSKYSTQA
jgi:hypothetical protein